MKAVVYRHAGEPEVLEFIMVPDPVPSDDELLIRVKAISIEGGELASRRQITPEAPFAILGNAAAGEIIGMGCNVKGFQIGQKVATFGFSGSYAELRAVRATESWIIPDELDYKIAAAIPCGLGTAALALHLAELRTNNIVLVQGATGGVGSAIVQLASNAGAQVIGTGTNLTTLAQLKPFGLTHALVADRIPIKEQVINLIGGKGVDICIDLIGGAALSEGIASLAPNGRLIIVGIKGAGKDIIDAAVVLNNRLTIRGCFLGMIMSDPDIYKMIAKLFDSVVRGEIHVPIDQVFPLEQAVTAHRRAEKRGRIGRVIMIP